MSWKNDRRKLRLKHQRMMLTLDRQVAAVLTGSSQLHSPAEHLDTEPQQPVPGAGSAGQPLAEVPNKTVASVTGNGGRGGARTPLGRLEGIAAAEEEKRQCSAVRRRPASALAVLQRSSEPAAATGPSEPGTAAEHWLPAPYGLFGAAQTVSNPRENPDGDVKPLSSSLSSAHVLGTLGGPAWGATEVRGVLVLLFRCCKARCARRSLLALSNLRPSAC